MAFNNFNNYNLLFLFNSSLFIFNIAKNFLNFSTLFKTFKFYNSVFKFNNVHKYLKAKINFNNLMLNNKKNKHVVNENLNTSYTQLEFNLDINFYNKSIKKRKFFKEISHFYLNKFFYFLNFLFFHSYNTFFDYHHNYHFYYLKEFKKNLIILDTLK